MKLSASGAYRRVLSVVVQGLSVFARASVFCYNNMANKKATADKMAIQGYSGFFLGNS